MRNLLLVLFFTLVLSFSVYADIGMDIDSVTSPIDPGENITITVTLENTEDVPVAPLRFTTSDATPAGGGPVLGLPDGTLKEITLSELESRTETVSFLIPSSAAPGIYTATLTATEADMPANTDSATYTFTVNEKPEVTLRLGSTVITDTLSIDLESGEDENPLTLTLTNTGNVPLSGVRLLAAFPDLEDNDGDTITISSTGSIATLGVGASATLTFNFDVESGFDEGSVDGTLVVDTTSHGASAPTTFRLNVKPLACLPNSRGTDLRLDIREPDNNDEFEPGETVEVELEIENEGSDDIDARIEAVLYNNQRDRRVDSHTVRRDIDEGDEETITFELELDEDDDDRMTLYVKVFDDDDDEELTCALDDVDVDVEVPEHSIQIRTPTLSPTSVQCGGSVSGSALLVNVGENDEDIVFDVFNSQLSVSQTSQSFEIEEDEDENDRVVNFAFNVPQTAQAGLYQMTLRARYSSELTLVNLPLQVMSCQQETDQETQQLPEDQEQADQGSTQNGFSAQGTGTFPLTGSTIYQDKSLFDNFGKGVPTSVWVLVNVLLVILIIAALVWLFRPR